MKILYLCQRIPYPPDRGDRIPVFHQLQQLRKNHEVVVGSLAHPGTRENALKLEKELGIKVLAPDHSFYQRIQGMILAFLQGKPLSLGYFRNPVLRSLIDEELARAEFDLIIVFSSSMAQYVENRRYIPRIMNFCDVDSQKWRSMVENSQGLQRWIYRRESRTLLKYEREIASAFEASCVVSQNEADLFRKCIPGIPVHVLENGVDVDYFTAVPRHIEALRIVFVGVMDYEPNVEAVSFFADRIWGKIQTAYPQARFIIVGSKPNKQVQSLARIPGIEVTGYVTDIRSYLSSATLSIAPLAIARGVQNKILEAMAAGVPVLTTPGVARGLPAGAEQFVFTAEREEESFASTLVKLLKNRDDLEETAGKAQEYVRRNCTWEAKLKTLDELIQKTTQKL